MAPLVTAFALILAKLDPLVLAPIIGVLTAAGGIVGGLYFARPRKDTLVAQAADTAVEAVTKSIARQTADLENQRVQLADQQAQLTTARERIAVLEAELQRTQLATTEALRASTAAVEAALRASTEASEAALRASKEASVEARRVAADHAAALETHIDTLRREVERLGGDVDLLNGNTRPDRGTDK
jgi:chromosome segregation ATPase